MRIPLIAGANKGASNNANMQELWNWFIESDKKSTVSERYLLPTPGNVLLVAAGNGPIRGMYVYNSLLFAVSGNTLYSITTAGTATSKGTLNTSSGPVSFADNGPANGQQLMIVDGTNGYIYDSSADTFTTISDADFPDTCDTVDFIDSYFVVNSNGTGRYYISNSYDGTAWTATDFATAESSPDNLVAVLNSRRELWLFGDRTTEIHFNSGDADFPFFQSQGGFMEKGCLAPHSVVEIDNSIMWLSNDERGRLQVVRANGYTPMVVSTPQITQQFSKYLYPEQARAYAYQDRGHEFYVLVFPLDDATWIYDVVENEWHRRSEWREGAHHMSRGICGAFFNGKFHVGDWENGNIYYLDPEIYTDNSNTIVRDLITPHLSNEEKRIFVREVQINMEEGTGLSSGQGSAPVISLRLSKDSHTWGSWMERNIGALGNYNTRVRWTKLGSGYNYVFHLRISDPVKAVILGATASVRTAREKSAA